jgi:hypothetical protein
MPFYTFPFKKMAFLNFAAKVRETDAQSLKPGGLKLFLGKATG